MTTVQTVQSPDRPDNNDLPLDGALDGRDGEAATVQPTVQSNPLKTKHLDGVDGMDANFRTQTGNGSEPGLSRRRLRELADWYQDPAS